jgi:glutamyl-Q tRNA(Asp) synthetase
MALVYRGRFAPTPSGPLHFGSITSALGSYLQAKSQSGKWLVRIEDIDKPRNQPGATENILYTLETLGLHWDEDILIQSQRIPVYREILEHLIERDLVYPCICSRSQAKGIPYPGTCRNGISIKKKNRSLRLRTDSNITEFVDQIQGDFHQQLGSDVGDFVLRRADGIIAYHLAVVADDEFQGITEIVRGADLLDSTPRQIYLQKLQDYSTPAYCHLPIATYHNGKKISKQNHAPGVDHKNAAEVLFKALEFLGQQPARESGNASVDEIIQWGIQHWNLSSVPGQHSIQVEK